MNARPRLFFALWPPDAVRTRIGTVADPLLRDVRGRRVAPADLHLTLAFLGALEDARADCCRRAADALRHPPFELRLDRVAAWPRARVTCLGTADVPTPLLDLASALERSLAACGHRPEPRRYQPHVTLVRAAAGADLPARACDPVVWPVDAFVLAESGPGDPRYRIRARWPLG